MSPKRALLLVVILLCTVGCDQGTKSLAKTYLSDTQSIVLLGDTVRLGLAWNYGAFLSLGASLGASSAGMVLSIVVALVVASMLGYLFVARPQNPWVGVAIGLIAGGGVSNLIDRLRYGYVVDFLNVGLGSLRTGIFNVADMAIMAGVLFWALGDRLWKPAEGSG